MLKWIILAIFIASALYIQQRGKVRHSFYRQFFDHSTILAPINYLMYLFSKVPNQPYIDTQYFQDLKVLDDNWEMIRDEAKALYEQGGIKASSSYDDLGFNSFFKTGWKRFYLKWYDSAHPSAAELCPKTTALLKTLPSIKAAMFTELAPDSRLVRHRDPYAGSLRYHLGLMTPNDDRCFIDVDGERYSWRDGEDRKTFKIKDGNLGEVKIADEVVAIIAGLAATEVEGVGSMAGNITNELVSKLGMKNLSKGIRVEVLEGTVNVDVALNISYGYSIPEVSAKVQDRVKNAIENMTGLEVSVVNIRIASVDMGNNK